MKIESSFYKFKVSSKKCKKKYFIIFTRFAEMGAEEKDSISHRGRALKALQKYFDKKE